MLFLSLSFRVAGFIANLRNGTPVKTVWPQLLEPLTGVDYEGAVAMSADTSLLLWENGTRKSSHHFRKQRILDEGVSAATRVCVCVCVCAGRVLQVVDMEEGRTLFTKEIDPEQYPRNRETRPCIVNTKTRVSQFYRQAAREGGEEGPAIRPMSTEQVCGVGVVCCLHALVPSGVRASEWGHSGVRLANR